MQVSVAAELVERLVGLDAAVEDVYLRTTKQRLEKRCNTSRTSRSCPAVWSRCWASTRLADHRRSCGKRDQRRVAPDRPVAAFAAFAPHRQPMGRRMYSPPRPGRAWRGLVARKTDSGSTCTQPDEATQNSSTRAAGSGAAQTQPARAASDAVAAPPIADVPTRLWGHRTRDTGCKPGMQGFRLYVRPAGGSLGGATPVSRVCRCHTSHRIAARRGAESIDTGPVGSRRPRGLASPPRSRWLRTVAGTRGRATAGGRPRARHPRRRRRRLRRPRGGLAHEVEPADRRGVRHARVALRWAAAGRLASFRSLVFDESTSVK